MKTFIITLYRGDNRVATRTVPLHAHDALDGLSEAACDFDGWRDRLAAGEPVNNTEGRAASHMALRGAGRHASAIADAAAMRERLYAFAEARDVLESLITDALTHICLRDEPEPMDYVMEEYGVKKASEARDMIHALRDQHRRAHDLLRNTGLTLEDLRVAVEADQ